MSVMGAEEGYKPKGTKKMKEETRAMESWELEVATRELTWQTEESRVMRVPHLLLCLAEGLSSPPHKSRGLTSGRYETQSLD